MCGQGSLQQRRVRRSVTLTRYEGHGVQLLPPLLRNDYILSRLCLSGDRVTLLVGVLYQPSDVLLVERIEHVPEVKPVWQSALRQLVGEVGQEVGLVFGEWIHVLDGELVVDRHVDELDLPELEQALIAAEHRLEEVLVHHGLRRQVQLHYTYGHGRGRALTRISEVLEEVVLALKLSLELAGHHHALLAALSLVGVDVWSVHVRDVYFGVISNY